jgi:ACS family hexuronate transporter-like MFS transporter
MRSVATPVSTPPSVKTWAHVRWGICALLFFATTINYIDRQVIGLLKPVLEKDLGWRESDYGWVVFAFQAAYAGMMPLAGRLIDKLGTRLGYLLAVMVWSAAAMCHALAANAVQFGIARFALGLGESANFPAALKTVASWFPLRERTLATGLFNSGSNIGAIIAPLCVPWLTIRFGWRSAFLITGAGGLLWMILWWAFYREPWEHTRISSAERLLIFEGRESAALSAPIAPERIPYARLLTDRAAWAYLIGKFLTDPVWWFYLFWLPGFLSRNYALDLSSLGLPLVVVYQASALGSIGGGWLSSGLLRRGWSLNSARKTAMLVCALAVMPLVFISQARGNLWLAIALISLGAAAHQGWSANIFNMPGDLFPRTAVGSVVGLGGMGGAVGGMLIAPAIGYWLDFSHGSYTPLFVAAGSMYLVALAIIHILAPRFTAVVEAGPAGTV